MLSVLVAVLLGGCRGHAIPPVFTGGSASVTDSAKVITSSAADTVKTADAWQSKAPSNDHYARVVQLQADIQAQAAKLNQTADGLKDAEKRCQQLAAENAKLKDEAEKANRALWRWLQFIGAIALIGAAALAYFAPPVAPVVGIAGAAAIGLGSVMLSYGWLINLVLVVVVLLGLCAVGAALWHKLKRDGFEVDRLADIWRPAIATLDAKAQAALAATRRTWPQLDKALTEAKP